MDSLLEVKGLKKAYDERQVVCGINFSLKKGEILGLIGPNGAGKSTTIRMIIDVEKKDKGEILYRGENVEHVMKQFKRSIGVVPQDIAVYEDLSAFDNVRFFCSLYGFRGRILKIGRGKPWSLQAFGSTEKTFWQNSPAV